jgi:uncharacterized membrane protein YvbJ
MVRRSCDACGAPLKHIENECEHCGSTYEQKKKLKQKRVDGFYHTKITSTIFMAIGVARFLNYGEATKAELIFWAALAILMLVHEKITINGVYTYIEKQRAKLFDELKKQ